MGDLLGVLSVLGVVLAVITLLGHGIWVLLAMLFGSGGSRSSLQQVSPETLSGMPR